MEYPFKFKALIITDKMLDILGFTEYWGGSGDFGDRRLDLGGQVEDKRLISKNEYPMYFIFKIDETDDPESGYGYSKPEYCSAHFCTKDFETIYFLHEMYDDIVARRTPEEIERFIEIIQKKGINMFPFIKSYMEYKKLTK